jgi:hypothetical protein
MAKKITWWAAAEILGVTDRTMRRWREKLEKDGYAGLESLFHAMVTVGIDYRRLLSEVRDAFPELAERDPGSGHRRPC